MLRCSGKIVPYIPAGRQFVIRALIEMQRQLAVCIAGIAADRAAYQFDLLVVQIDIIAVVKIRQVQIIQLGDALSHIDGCDGGSVAIPGCMTKTEVAIFGRAGIITGKRERTVAAQLQRATVQQIPEGIAGADLIHIAAGEAFQRNVDALCTGGPAAMIRSCCILFRKRGSDGTIKLRFYHVRKSLILFIGNSDCAPISGIGFLKRKHISIFRCNRFHVADVEIDFGIRCFIFSRIGCGIKPPSLFHLVLLVNRQGNDHSQSRLRVVITIIIVDRAACQFNIRTLDLDGFEVRHVSNGQRTNAGNAVLNYNLLDSIFFLIPIRLCKTQHIGLSARVGIIGNGTFTANGEGIAIDLIPNRSAGLYIGCVLVVICYAVLLRRNGNSRCSCRPAIT